MSSKSKGNGGGAAADGGSAALNVLDEDAGTAPESPASAVLCAAPDVDGAASELASGGETALKENERLLTVGFKQERKREHKLGAAA